jgi:5-methylthioadenosine/S-adenosylhomocysteine deaminase
VAETAAAGAPQNVDLLITDVNIVTFDDANSVITDGAIAVRGNAILWIGSATQAKMSYKAANVIDGKGMIAMPGLIDGHYHTGQQLLRGKLASIRRAGPTKMPSWKNYLVTFECGLTPEDVYYGSIAGYASMISTGTTCFMEAGGPHPDDMGRAADKVGIRGDVSLNTMDMDETLPANYRMTTSQALKENEALVKRWRNHPRVNACLSLRQIIVNTEDLRRGMIALAKELDTYIHTHLSEGTYEVDYTMKHYGLRPPDYMDSIGAFNERVHCAHSILLTDSEMDLYAARGATACHCAFGNYGTGFHQMAGMVRRGVAIGIGTDGPGGHCTMDLFQVAHYAVLGQRIVNSTLTRSDNGINYESILKIAVRNGARIARKEGKIGCLKPGLLADIILVNTTDYDQFPVVDPVITLTQNCVGRDVRTVIVDGQVVMKDREILTFDTDATRAKVQQQYNSIMDRYHATLDSYHTPH